MTPEMVDVSISLRLAAQRALWGAVPPRLRAVSVELRGHTIHVRSIFDGEPNDAERDELSCVAAEIIADFSAPYIIEEELLAVPHPSSMAHLKWLVYLRNDTEFRWVYAA